MSGQKVANYVCTPCLNGWVKDAANPNTRSTCYVCGGTCCAHTQGHGVGHGSHRSR